MPLMCSSYNFSTLGMPRIDQALVYRQYCICELDPLTSGDFSDGRQNDFCGQNFPWTICSFGTFVSLSTL